MYSVITIKIPSQTALNFLKLLIYFTKENKRKRNKTFILRLYRRSKGINSKIKDNAMYIYEMSENICRDVGL